MDDDSAQPLGHTDQLAEQVALLSQDYIQAQQLSAEQVALELNQARASFALQRSVAHWRRVLFLALLPQATAADREAALEFLQTHPRPVAAASNRSLYLVSEEVLATHLQLRQEVREFRQNQATRAQLIDALEQQLQVLTAARDRLGQDNRSLQEQLRKEQVRSETLQRQLDEIRNIEKTLEDRNRTTPAELPGNDDPSQR